jgi:hypothetical protein
MMKKLLLGVCITLLLAGCANPPINMSEGAKSVKVGKSDPTDNYSEIGPITATDGHGCGGFGILGTYDQAVIILKNDAFEKGGDYVQIMTLTAPHSEYGCFANPYTISGTLFKKTSNLSSVSTTITNDKQSVTNRLKELEALRKNGTIDDREYAAKRLEILKSL